MTTRKKTAPKKVGAERPTAKKKTARKSAPKKPAEAEAPAPEATRIEPKRIEPKQIEPGDYVWHTDRDAKRKLYRVLSVHARGKLAGKCRIRFVRYSAAQRLTQSKAAEVGSVEIAELAAERRAQLDAINPLKVERKPRPAKKPAEQDARRPGATDEPKRERKPKEPRPPRWQVLNVEQDLVASEGKVFADIKPERERKIELGETFIIRDNAARFGSPCAWRWRPETNSWEVLENRERPKE